MVKSIITFIFILSVGLTLNSCTVDCEIECIHPDGLMEPYTNTRKMNKDKCSDCDFAEIDIQEALGYDCECYY